MSNACAQGGRPSPVSAMSCDSELGRVQALTWVTFVDACLLAEQTWPAWFRSHMTPSIVDRLGKNFSLEQS